MLQHPHDAAWRARAACSSSFMALHDAVVDLQRGRVEYAVVGGSSAIFRPAMSLAFLRLKCARITSQRHSLTPASSLGWHRAYLRCCEHAAVAARAATV